VHVDTSTLSAQSQFPEALFELLLLVIPAVHNELHARKLFQLRARRQKPVWVDQVVSHDGELDRALP